MERISVGKLIRYFFGVTLTNALSRGNDQPAFGRLLRQAFGQSPTAPSIQQQVNMLYAQAPPPMGPPGTGMAAARPAAPPANPNDPWNKGANILNFS